MPRPDRSSNLLDRLISEAQADDYALAADRTQSDSLLVRGLTVVVMVAVGVLLATAAWQQRTQQPNREAARVELISRIEIAEARGDATARTAAELRSTVSTLQRLATVSDDAGLAADLAELEAATGYVALRSAGVTLILDDAQQAPKGVDSDETRVLDIDVQLGVNGLWRAGAQAVSVNDVRLTSTTAIRTAGEAILVDYRPLRPPYEIVALGDPEALESQFLESDAADNLAALQTDYGIQWELTAADNLTVPASTADLPRRAEVVR